MNSSSLDRFFVVFRFQDFSNGYTRFDNFFSAEYKIPKPKIEPITLVAGLRNGGGIGDVLRSPSNNESLFAFRVLYDMLFFFIVIIIVLNLIFGVIIDTFADLR